MLFNERELSKKDFERIDIDVRSMPKEIKEKLLNGELTPLLEIRDQLDNGIIATMPVKLRLQRSEDGKAVLKAYPVSKDIVSDLRPIRSRNSCRPVKSSRRMSARVTILARCTCNSTKKPSRS